MSRTPLGSDALRATQRAAALADDMASFTERDEVVGLSALQRLTG